MPFLKYTKYITFYTVFIENYKVFTIILQMSLEVLPATDFGGSCDI